jgi:hypothetical protein
MKGVNFLNLMGLNRNRSIKKFPRLNGCEPNFKIAALIVITNSLHSCSRFLKILGNSANHAKKLIGKIRLFREIQEIDEFS